MFLKCQPINSNRSSILLLISLFVFWLLGCLILLLVVILLIHLWLLLVLSSQGGVVLLVLVLLLDGAFSTWLLLANSYHPWYLWLLGNVHLLHLLIELVDHLLLLILWLKIELRLLHGITTCHLLLSLLSLLLLHLIVISQLLLHLGKVFTLIFSICNGDGLLLMSSGFLLLWLLGVGLSIILLIDCPWLGDYAIDLIELVLNLLTLPCHVESTIYICTVSSKIWVSRECLSIHQVVVVILNSASS